MPARFATTASSAFFSLPSSWARFASSQTFGSSSSRAIVSRRVRFASKSKIPPQLGGSTGEVRERIDDYVDPFGVHGEVPERGGLYARVAAARPSGRYDARHRYRRIMADPSITAERSGRSFTAIFVACVGLLGFALYLQHVKGLDPCPWCVVQRIGFMLVGLIALVGALHRPGIGGTVGYSILGFGAAAAGAAAGAYHVWLQSDPARAAKCVGSPVERILDELQVGRIAPPLLQYDGPCTLKPWSLLGLSIPEWSLAWFVLLAAVFLALPFVVRR
jgi:disulfide bond formation protein DsbB